MDIVEELRRDRESGAKRLVNEYKAGMMSLAMRFCADESSAEELVNATFAKVVANIDGYLEQSAFFAWMCQILTNLYRDSVKRTARKNEVLSGDVPDMPDDDAREEIFRNVDHSLLRDAIETLPKEMKEAIMLHYIADQPIGVVARFLRLPVSTVKWRLHAARRELSRRLGAKVSETARKPGGKALLLALALACTAALGAAVWSLASGWGEPSRRADATWTSETGETGGTGVTDVGFASLASPAGSSLPSTFSVGEQNMNATTLRTFAASAALAASVAAQASAAGGTWYVSPSGSSGATGLSENSPLASINEAISRASAGDTIYLLPGDYDEGGAAVTLSNSLVRVHVTKKLTIRSLGGRAARDATRIVGAWDAAATSPVGMGSRSVRCMWIDPAASGTVVEGVTFYRGATPYNGNASSLSATFTGGGGAYQQGGASNSASGMEKTYFVDCAFVECAATRGGGLYSEPFNNAWSVAAVRCLFKRCRDTQFGAGMRGGCAHFCVFDDCAQARNAAGAAVGGSGAAHAFSYGNRALNCTFVNNEGHGIQVADNGNFKAGIMNCLFQNNGGGAILNPDTTSGTKDGNTGNIAYTERMEVFSPFDSDYRLTDVATAASAGKPEHVATVAQWMPAGFGTADYAGAEIDTAAETIAAGAVQETLDEPTSGVGFGMNANGVWTLDGDEVSVLYRTWRGVFGWPVPQHVGFEPKAGFAVVRFSFGGSVLWPLRDDTAWVHPSEIGVVQTLNATTTDKIFWADPVNGSDGNAGTESAPFKTLNKAVRAMTGTHVVMAKAGDYASAEEVSGGVKNRVVVPDTLAGDLRVVAVDGPERTFITGAADTTDDYGAGANAIRCIAVDSMAGNRAAFQGFTLRNGHAAAKEDTAGSYGGAVRNMSSTTTSPKTAFLLDCVVRDCGGYRGGAIAGGTAMRCRVENCTAGHNGLFRYCSVVSSLVTGCSGVPIVEIGASAFNCTFYANEAAAVGVSVEDRLRNCVVGGRTDGDDDLNVSALSASQVYCTLYSKNSAAGVANLNATVKAENPLRLRKPARGDYRLRNDSAGIDLASTEHMQSCMDIDGSPFVFDAVTGTYQAGCFAAAPDDAVPPTMMVFR